VDSVAPKRFALQRVPAIERMRESANEQVERLSLSTVRAVVDGVTGAYNLSAIAQSAKIDESSVMDIVAELGTWLTHVHGKAEVSVRLAIDEEQPSLFAQPGGGDVVVPLGFERRGPHRRDLSRSIASICARQPDDTELGRWLDHKYPSEVGVLTGSDVFLIWTLARLGRLDEIDLLPSSRAFTQVVIAAFDLLDVGLTDARGGVAVLYLTGMGEMPVDIEQLQIAATKAAWLGEARMARISRFLGLGDSASSQRGLENELGNFAREVSANQQLWLPRTIASLGEGQVLRLVQRAGLGKADDHRKTEAEIRNKLIERGLRKDLDRLLPYAMRAVAAGAEAEYWAAIDARVSGDPDWRIELDETLAAHSVGV